MGCPSVRGVDEPGSFVRPELVAGNLTDYWIYLVGPIIGGLIAVGFEFILKGKPTKGRRRRRPRHPRREPARPVTNAFARVNMARRPDTLARATLGASTSIPSRRSPARNNGRSLQPASDDTRAVASTPVHSRVPPSRRSVRAYPCLSGRIRSVACWRITDASAHPGARARPVWRSTTQPAPPSQRDGAPSLDRAAGCLGAGGPPTQGLGPSRGLIPRRSAVRNSRLARSASSRTSRAALEAESLWPPASFRGVESKAACLPLRRRGGRRDVDDGHGGDIRPERHRGYAPLRVRVGLWFVLLVGPRAEIRWVSCRRSPALFVMVSMVPARGRGLLTCRAVTVVRSRVSTLVAVATVRCGPPLGARCWLHVSRARAPGLVSVGSRPSSGGIASSTARSGSSRCPVTSRPS